MLITQGQEISTDGPIHYTALNKLVLMIFMVKFNKRSPFSYYFKVFLLFVPLNDYHEQCFRTN